ncbi:Gfo/Idh/MocA family protein [Streptomyces sp. NPDC002913]
MRIAIVGCGYAADFYAITAPNHPLLEIIGVYDRVPERQQAFADYHGFKGYESLDALLNDPAVEIVVNVTNPLSHAAVTRAALMAGKHVYSEKPFALDLGEAKSLVELAKARGLELGSAPCNLLSETAQTVWQAIRRGTIGTPRLAYAELDAGPLLRLPFQKWVSSSGAPWPYHDELVTGCTIEHAGYYLTWLTAFFGPATQVTAFASSIVPKGHLVADESELAPDFSVACMTFADGVVGRVTTGISAPNNQSLRIIGDEGVLEVADGGHFGSPVSVTYDPEGGDPVELPLVRDTGRLAGLGDHHNYDFARGVADFAAAVAGKGTSHLPTDHALHVLELTLTMANATEGVVAHPETTFAPVPPMPWAV